MDAVLQAALAAREGLAGVPGVVAVLTDRRGPLYEGACGVREKGQPTALQVDDVFGLFSITKAFTAVCVMQLVEEGRISLEEAAGRHVPEIDTLQVLQGFDDQGQPITRPAKRRIRVLDLLLHTSGLGYEFFCEGELKYRQAMKVPPLSACTLDSVRTVLLHEPGERWTYGTSLDWAGLLVERVRGQRLAEVMHQRLFEPLGMHDTAFHLREDMRARRVSLHMRKPDGSVVARPGPAPEAPPPMDMGGQGAFGTAGDVAKFIRMMLNEGQGEHGRVLKPQTVAHMAADALAPMGLSVGGWSTVLPQVTRSGEIFPEVDKGWALSFMTNRQRTPTGRSEGSLMWAGLANLYYWIDLKAGVGGVWATQMLPFLDAVSYPAFEAFEAAAYRTLAARP